MYSHIFYIPLREQSPRRDTNFCANLVIFSNRTNNLMFFFRFSLKKTFFTFQADYFVIFSFLGAVEPAFNMIFQPQPPHTSTECERMGWFYGIIYVLSVVI